MNIIRCLTRGFGDEQSMKQVLIVDLKEIIPVLLQGIEHVIFCNVSDVLLKKQIKEYILMMV